MTRPTISVIERTIKERIREIDWECDKLRAEQRGLEKALAIVLGETPVTEKRK
jgi:hypothetical protein